MPALSAGASAIEHDPQRNAERRTERDAHRGLIVLLTVGGADGDADCFPESQLNWSLSLGAQRTSATIARTLARWRRLAGGSLCQVSPPCL
jgi:hypothetical protein